ncbi:MAG: tRNA 2-thiouridine(34) synthase MnmA [Anaerolineales bacterium]
MTAKPVVAIAMSGGVDSSVAAALLVERGYTVIGTMLRLWSEQDSDRANRCCTPDSMAMARRVASILSIPFYVLDARQFFYDAVVKSFIHDYKHNLTPNPCITCNRIVRWGFLLNHAQSAGADFLATGHYARITLDHNHTYQLLRGVDAHKDQSYVLHVLTQTQLDHALFPLGDYTKQEVRQMAHKYNLPVAEQPDSQDLCFVGADGDYRHFLARHTPQALSPGQIIDCDGNLLGQHEGLAFFTIGQRKGLRISSAAPLYVLEKDFPNNTIIVGTRDQSEVDHLVAENVNWIAGEPPKTPFSALVKIRYKSHDISGVVSIINDNAIHVKFENPIRDITPGQAAVLYNGEVCLGGGIISNQAD